MIYCNLKGGLGNMLFQIAATKSISIDNKTECSFPNLYTHCIGFNESIYDLVINLLEKRQKPVDVYYSDIQKGYECYSFNPSIALQRASYSDIQNKEQDNRWLF